MSASKAKRSRSEAESPLPVVPSSQGAPEQAAVPVATGSTSKKSARKSQRVEATSESCEPANVSRALGLNSNPSSPLLIQSTTQQQHAGTETDGTPLTIFTTPVIAPDPSGIRCIATDALEQHLVVARENGSLTLYKLDLFQNVPHFLVKRSTGGRSQRTIVRLAFVKDGTAILAAYVSGQIAVLDSRTLLPISVFHRFGGAIHDMVVHNDVVLTACSDGSWRVHHYDAVRKSLDFVHTAPKVSGSDRAVSVAVSEQLKMAVGGDDAGNIVAWKIDVAPGAHSTEWVERTAKLQHTQLWSTRIPKGIPMSIAICSAGNVTPIVAVGTSIGDVILIDVALGTMVKRFSQHKGPVSTLTTSQATGVIYASGWHESLRCYRYDVQDEEWYPAEVKRRTHYHEASQLLYLNEHHLILSASRDGTIMYAPASTVFHVPAHYLDATGQCIAFASEAEVLLQNRNRTIEGFKMSGTRSHWVPLFSYTLKECDGPFGVHGLWCDKAMDAIAIATDTCLSIVHVVHNQSSVTSVKPVLDLELCGVVDCVLDCGNAYVITNDTLLHVTLQRLANDDGSTRMVGISASKLLPQDYYGGFDAVHTSRGFVVLTGSKGVVRLALLEDGSLDPQADFAVVNRNTMDNAAVTSSSTLVGLTDGSTYQADSTTLSKTLPHDTTFIRHIKGESEGGKVYLGSFSKGLLLASKVTWSMVTRQHLVKAFEMRDPNAVLVVNRNVEASVEALPMCWKVRRFGN